MRIARNMKTVIEEKYKEIKVLKYQANEDRKKHEKTVNALKKVINDDNNEISSLKRRREASIETGKFEESKPFRGGLPEVLIKVERKEYFEVDKKPGVAVLQFPIKETCVNLDEKARQTYEGSFTQEAFKQEFMFRDESHNCTVTASARGGKQQLFLPLDTARERKKNRKKEAKEKKRNSLTDEQKKNRKKEAKEKKRNSLTDKFFLMNY